MVVDRKASGRQHVVETLEGGIFATGWWAPLNEKNSFLYDRCIAHLRWWSLLVKFQSIRLS